jgi:hypothetical protein
MPMVDVFRVVRALDFVPWEPAFVEAQDKTFYLWVADSLGRAQVVPPDLIPLPAVSCLGDLDRWDFKIGILGHLPRPVAIAESGTYGQLFPIFGTVVGAAHGD